MISRQLFARRFSAQQIKLFETANGYRLNFTYPALNQPFAVYSTSDWNLESFLKALQTDCTHIKDIQALHPQTKEKLDSNTNFNSIIKQDNSLILKINEQDEIELKIANVCNPQKQYDWQKDLEVCRSISQHQKEFLNNAFSSLIQNADQPVNLTDFKDRMENIIKNLGSSHTPFQDIFSLEQQLEQVRREIDPIQQVKEKIDKKLRRSSNLRLFFGLSSLSAQWFFFYYTIFQIDWLGWDLMEPVTYSVGQITTSFYAYLYLRNQIDIAEWEEFWNGLKSGKITKFKAKFQFDNERYKWLKLQEIKLLQQIEELKEKIN